MILSNELVVKIDNKFHTVTNLLQARELVRSLYSSSENDSRYLGIKTELWEISGAYSMESDNSLLTPINRLKSKKVGEIDLRLLAQLIMASAVRNVMENDDFTINSEMNIRELIKGEEDIKWFMESI